MIITAIVIIKTDARITLARGKARRMSLSLLPLLLVEDGVPASARAALREANDAPPHERQLHLEAAARALYQDAHLDCADARELVGLG